MIRKVNLHIVLLLAVGLAFFLIKCSIAYRVKYVGHADAAAYAEMADSLIHGRGFEVDYISWYFEKYDPKIVRPEDHWPPLYSMAIAPFFLIFGKTAFAAKLPSLIISCFFLPLVLYSLAKELSGSKWPGLAAGLGIMLYPAAFGWSLLCLSDVTYAFVVSAMVLYSVKALDDEKSFYYAGIFIGLAYYAKGTGLLLIPGHILFHVIARRSIKKAFTHRKFLISLLIAFLILLPWFVRNFVHFGDPLYSTQRFTIGYWGYKNWEGGTYTLYWGEKPLPKYSDKFKDGVGFVAKNIWDYIKTYTWWTFMDINNKWGKSNQYAFLTYFVNIPAFLGFAVLWGNKKRHIIWITSASLVLFLSVWWYPIGRLTLPVICIMMALGWATYFIILRMILRALSKIPLRKLGTKLKVPFASRLSILVPRFQPQIANLKSRIQMISLDVVAGFMVCCLAMPVVVLSTESVQTAIKKNGYPYREGAQEWMDMGSWLKENVPPDSITMTRNPWELHFYSEQLAIQIPRASLEKTIEVIRYYKPTYIIPQLNIRPSLKPLVEGEVPGLELVYDNKKIQLYKINYDLLPKLKE
ncbi:ArnT family glycosyltransferase [Candidatus Poribacteria bacterium]